MSLKLLPTPGAEPAPKRKSMSKKLRFEVFKRDGFKCMYCGAEAPKAVLHVDHIKPVAKGGTNTIMNLVTACDGCNGGKGARELSDDSVITKQRGQIDELQARREQMEMMLAWREGLQDLTEEQVERARSHWERSVPGWHIQSGGALKLLRGFVKKHGLKAVLDAIDIAVDRYVKADAEGRIASEFAQQAWAKVGGILHISGKTPEQQRLHYVKGILNKRLSYVPYTAMREMEDGLKAGIDVEDMVAEAKRTRSWSSFSYWLEHEAE